MGEQVSMERLEKFVRQLSHDLRNDLNAIDLLSVYVREMVEDEEVGVELSRLRESVQYAVQRLVKVSRAFQEPVVEWVDYPFGVLCEGVREQAEREAGGAVFGCEWVIPEGTNAVKVDGIQVLEALGELVRNALTFREGKKGIRIVGEVVEGEVWWRVEQRMAVVPKGVERWGHAPFESSQRAAYGLGLYRARRVLEAQGAQLGFRYEKASQILWTEVCFGREREGGR